MEHSKSPKWNVFIAPIPSKIMNRRRRGDRKFVIPKEIASSRQKRTDALVNSQTLAADTRPAQVQARCGPNTEREKWTRSLTPNKEAIYN